MLSFSPLEDLSPSPRVGNWRDPENLVGSQQDQEAKKKIIDLGIFSQDIWISIYGWNVSTMATLGREESGRCREVLNKSQCMDFFPPGWKRWLLQRGVISRGQSLARLRRIKPLEIKLEKKEKKRSPVAVFSLYKQRALAKTLNIELFLVVSIIWSIIILKLEFRLLRWLMRCLEQDQIEIDCEQSLFCLKINISVCHNAGMRAASCTSTCITRNPWPRRWYTSLLRVLSLVVE